MAINNVSKINDNHDVNINRNAIEHRATWMGLIFDEARKAGLDAEAICRAAIKRCGNFHGNNMKAAAGSTDCTEFRKVFIPELTTNTFEMDVVANDENTLNIEFHYCPLLTAWKKQGFDDATCELLCDIAMDGDRGIAQSMGYEFSLTDTIAKGCEVCKVGFCKK